MTFDLWGMLLTTTPAAEYFLLCNHAGEDMCSTRRMQATEEAVPGLRRSSKAHGNWESNHGAQSAHQGNITAADRPVLGKQSEIRVLFFFNVRFMPCKNLSYSHKHLKCSINHRSC